MKIARNLCDLAELPFAFALRVSVESPFPSRCGICETIHLGIPHKSRCGGCSAGKTAAPHRSGRGAAGSVDIHD